MRHFLLSSCFLLVCAAVVCSAQDQFVSFGVKAGIPATPALPGLSYDNPYLDTRRWTVGPSLELNLFSGLSFETDALFRGYTVIVAYVLFPTASSPLQDTGSVRPFVDGDYSVTHESTDVFASSGCLSGTPPCASNLTYYNGEFTNSRSLTGPVAGTGVAGVSF
jgi:hypothetical protein